MLLQYHYTATYTDTGTKILLFNYFNFCSFPIVERNYRSLNLTFAYASSLNILLYYILSVV